MQEEKKEIKQELDVLDKGIDKTKKKLDTLFDVDLKQENIELIYALTDVLKDLTNIRKEEYKMRYGMDDYGRGYRGYGTENYGRRGVPGTGRGRYRGEEMLDEMKYHYGNYQDSYNNGNYNAKEDSSYKMTEAFKEFVYAVGEELDPKDKQMFKQAMQEMVQKLN